MSEIEQWIIQILYDGPPTTMVVDISEEIGVSCFAINGHLSILEKMGLIRSVKKSGVVNLYLTESGIQEAIKIFGGKMDGRALVKTKGSDKIRSQ